jgi:hypothetical protein
VNRRGAPDDAVSSVSLALLIRDVVDEARNLQRQSSSTPLGPAERRALRQRLRGIELQASRLFEAAEGGRGH